MRHVAIVRGKLKMNNFQLGNLNFELSIKTIQDIKMREIIVKVTFPYFHLTLCNFQEVVQNKRKFTCKKYSMNKNLMIYHNKSIKGVTSLFLGRAAVSAFSFWKQNHRRNVQNDTCFFSFPHHVCDWLCISFNLFPQRDRSNLWVLSCAFIFSVNNDGPVKLTQT